MLESLNIFKKPKTSKLSYELDDLSKKYLATSARKNIQKAVDFADKAHDGQFRKSGEPFLIHPINVGIILAGLKMDGDTIVAGLLHDVVEDCEISLKEVKEMTSLLTTLEGTKWGELNSLNFDGFNQFLI